MPIDLVKVVSIEDQGLLQVAEHGIFKEVPADFLDEVAVFTPGTDEFDPELLTVDFVLNEEGILEVKSGVTELRAVGISTTAVDHGDLIRDNHF